MKNIKTFFSPNIIKWLLEEQNPSVRYFALVDLLDESINSPKVLKTKQQIMTRGRVPAILTKQNPEGYWDIQNKFYTAKYKGTVWQLLILAELYADKDDTRIKKACEFILDVSQDEEGGAFSIHTYAKKKGGNKNYIIPCLTGNMVFSFLRFGYLQDNRLQRAINWLATYQRFDDVVDTPPTGWPYDRFEVCFGKHTCHMGVVKCLKGLAEIPEAKHTRKVKKTIDKCIKYLLDHHIYKKSHNLKEVAKPGWLRFGFPLMYQTDVLEILDILTALGVKHRNMQDAIDIVCNKRETDGKWLLKNTFNGKYHVDIESKGQPSKWITLRALRILKRYYTIAP